MKPERQRRPIRSFVLRQGRLTRGQQRAFERYWSRFGLEYQDDRFDLHALFGNDNPVYLEIGFGNGESLAEMARGHPERNYIGVEVHAPGVGHLLMRLGELGLSNVRVFRHDAVEVLRDCFPDHSLAGVYLFFPDPWHKKRHRKRRIVQADFLTLLARKLRPGGIFHAATDWEDYAHHMRLVLNEHPEFRNTAEQGDFVPRPEDRPRTKFERRGQRLGHGVWDLIFERRG
ncbi:MAG: tRNA (guanosine(46)-N7)-methyltransferase TrmB [Gammaproteobacteria bacterium]|nr:MAG: tRNA (guanosine(46)-N7)-methyltransferase TrmB [Gammaproteobacteria bacterium]